MIILDEKTPHLEEIRDIKNKVDYIYNRLKELEEISSALLPTIEDMMKTISSRIEEITSDERFIKFKRFAENFDEITKSIENLKEAFESVINNLLTSYPELFSMLELDKYLRLVDLLKFDLDKVIRNLENNIQDIKSLIESEDFYSILSITNKNINNIKYLMDNTMNVINDIREHIPVLMNSLKIACKFAVKINMENILKEIYNMDVSEEILLKYLRILNVINNIFKELKPEELDVIENILKTIISKDSIRILKECNTYIKDAVENMPLLLGLLSTIKNLSREETIKFLENAASLINNILQILNNRMTNGISKDISTIIDTLSKPDVLNKLKVLVEALEETSAKKYGRFSMLSVTGDEDFQYGVGFFIELMKNLGKRVKS